jgi:hypothetical protein
MESLNKFARKRLNKFAVSMHGEDVPRWTDVVRFKEK